MSLYLKYRPKNFDDIVNQRHIIDILKTQIQKQDVNNNYLFFGQRGTGKTTAARVLAQSINCENPNDGNPCNECNNCKFIIKNSTLDFVEIDAASHTQVDNIREEILEKAPYPPSNLKKKVYIIDEVHMLSKASFNALLKIMEEPPEYLMFILATTEINKVPDTILSRCQVFNFKNIEIEDILERLKYICKQEDIKFDDSALRLIAEVSDGALRDAIKYIEQVSILGEINEENVTKFLGIAPSHKIKNFLELLHESNIEKTFHFLEELQSSGIDLNNFLKQCLLYIDSKFLEDPDYYSNISNLFSSILSNIKKYPYPIIVYKLEIYKYLKGNDELEDSISNFSKKEETKTKTEENEIKDSNNKKEEDVDIKKEEHKQEGKNEKEDFNEKTETKDEGTQNINTKDEGDYESVLNEVINNCTKLPVKAALKRYTNVNSIENGIVSLWIISKPQYNLLLKDVNFSHLKELFEKVLGKEVNLHIEYVSKEDFLSSQLG